MKKKLLNGLLMVALIVAATSSFVSCKDYDEDRFNSLQYRISDDATLIEGIEAQIAALDQHVKLHHDSLISAYLRLADIDDSIGVHTLRMDTLLNMINAIAQCECNKDSLDSIAGVVAELKDKLAGVNTDGTIGNSGMTLIQIVEKLNELAAIQDAVGKAYVDSLDSVQGIAINDLTERINLLWSDSIKKAYEDAATALATANKNAITIQTLASKDTLKNFVTKDQLQNWVTQDQLKDWVTQDQLKNWVTQDQLKDWVTQDQLEALAKKDTLKYYATKEELADSTEQLRKEADSLFTKANEIAKAYLDSALAALKDSSIDLNTRIKDVRTAFEKADSALSERIDSVSNAVQALTPQVEKNTTDIANLKSDVEKLNKQVESILKSQVTGVIVQSVYNPVFGNINLPVNVQTNVLVGIYGKNSGSAFTFPTGENSAGEPEVEILTAADKNAIGNIKETAEIKSGIITDEEGKAYAGKLYLTVNPNTTDFTGKTVELVNSQDQASGLTLSALKKSDATLAFGWTTRADNGFYETEATIPLGKISTLKPHITIAGDKTALKNIVKQKNLSSIVAAAKQVYSNALADVETSDGVLDALGVKATWQDADGVNHNVYSEYKVAATAVKPLSYETFSGYRDKSVKSIFTRVENFITKVTNEVKNRIKVDVPAINLGISQQELLDHVTISVNEIGEISLTDEQIEKFNVDVKIRLDSSWVQTVNVPLPELYYEDPISGERKQITDADGNLIESVSASTNIWFHYDSDEHNNQYGQDLRSELQSLIDQLNDQLDNVNGSIDNVNSLQGNLNSMIDQLNSLIESLNGMNDNINTQIDQAVDDVIKQVKNGIDNLKQQVFSYIDKLYNKVKGITAAPNEALQPCMLVKTKGGFQLVNHTGGQTKVTTNDIVMIPTSYTAEILAPAYKKFLAVTKVTKNGVAQSGKPAQINAANEDLAKVLPGKTYAVALKGLEAGCKYEILYAAVDYHGKVAVRKYYIAR